MHLSKLPPEVVVRVLSYLNLDASSILSFTSTIRQYHDLLKNTISLQYTLELQRHGMVQRSYSPLLLRERLSFLRERELNWHDLALDQKVSLRFPLAPLPDISVIFNLDIDRGTIFYSNRSTYLHTLRLPYCDHKEPPEWTSILPRENVVAYSTIIDHYDLLAVVTRTSTGTGPDEQSIFKLHILKFSTLTPHPLANKPVIEFSVLEPRYPGAADDLAVTIDFGESIYVSFFYVSGMAQRKFMFIADWKMGTMALSSHGVPPREDCKSTKIFFNPMWTQGSLLYVHINYYADTTTFEVIRKFKLPKLKEGYSYRSSGHDFNPIIPRDQDFEKYSLDNLEYRMRSSTGHAILANEAHSIATFKIHIHDDVHDQTVPMYTLTCRLDKLLDYERKNPRQPGAATVPVMSWEEWGPQCCRWDEIPPTIGWNYLSCWNGQRHVTLQDNGRVSMRDYNPHYVRDLLSKRKRSSKFHYPKVVTASTITPCEEWFENDIVTSLPYVEMKSAEICPNYVRLMMTEDHFVGLYEDFIDTKSFLLDIYTLSPENFTLCGCENDSGAIEAS